MTISKMENLEELSQLGHFLKGSSATLGLNLVRNSCEKIQHLGHFMDEKGEREETQEYCLRGIRRELEILREEYKRDEKALKKFYGENVG